MAPATDWKERLDPGEAAQFERFAEQIREGQRRRARRRPIARALHVKAHAGVEAELTVLPNLPEHARVGVFATPRTFRAWVRFSNGAGFKQSDLRPDARGVAIKVLGVEGKKLIPGMENATTQDFLCQALPITPFKNADEFVWFLGAVRSPATLLPRAVLKLGPLGAVRLISRLLASAQVKITSMATCAFYSALPIRFGPHAVHYSLEPHARPSGDRRANADYLAEELAARLAAGPVSFDFNVRFFVDEATTPIEDGSVAWTQPTLTVARLTIPRQLLGDDRGLKIAELIETLSFDPWHALEAHRPLGNMMRARNAAYRLVTLERKAADEPDGTEQFDAKV